MFTWLLRGPVFTFVRIASISSFKNTVTGKNEFLIELISVEILLLFLADHV